MKKLLIALFVLFVAVGAHVRKAQAAVVAYSGYLCTVTWVDNQELAGSGTYGAILIQASAGKNCSGGIQTFYFCSTGATATTTCGTLVTNSEGRLAAVYQALSVFLMNGGGALALYYESSVSTSGVWHIQLGRYI